MKKKQRNILLIITLVIGLVLVLSNGGFRLLSISPSTNIQISESDLPCSSYDSCISYLKSEGMPDNFLNQKNLQIICNSGKCKLKKK